MKETPEVKQAKNEIKAWTVDGTPTIEMISGLMGAYQGRSENDKEAFVEVLIDFVASIRTMTFSPS